jgi:hypothetical protein
MDFTLLVTQVPVLGAFIWFLIHHTKQTAANEKRRDEWFTQTLANQDQTFKDSLTMIVSHNAQTTERICERLDKMKTSIIACKFNKGNVPPGGESQEFKEKIKS